MASDESMTVVSSMQEDEYDDIDVGFDHDHEHEHDHHSHPHNLSRLSMCTSSMYTNEDDDDNDVDDDGQMGLFMSRLSIESFDADVDEEEFSEFSSDSDKELPNCYSLPATPPRGRRNRATQQLMMTGVGLKDYASENEAAAQRGSRPRPRGRKDWRKRRVIRERWGLGDGDGDSRSSGRKKDGGEMNMMTMMGGNYSNYSGSFSGESEGGGVVLITRPKGGRRSLCMDLDEVKACRDLGFELEHERMLEMPARPSLSASTLDTGTLSSGGNSPIANWRISSPGDDPRDVKARLKVWAQAVALASTTSKH